MDANTQKRNGKHKKAGEDNVSLIVCSATATQVLLECQSLISDAHRLANTLSGLAICTSWPQDENEYPPRLALTKKQRRMLHENDDEIETGWSTLSIALKAQQALVDKLYNDHVREMVDSKPAPVVEQKPKKKKKKNKKNKNANTKEKTDAETHSNIPVQQDYHNNLTTAQPTDPLTRPSAQPKPIIVVPPKTSVHRQKTPYFFMAQLDEYNHDVIELRKRQHHRQVDINEYNQLVMDEPGTRILRDVDGLPVLPSKDFRRRGSSEKQQMRSAGY